MEHTTPTTNKMPWIIGAVVVVLVFGIILYTQGMGGQLKGTLPGGTNYYSVTAPGATNPWIPQFGANGGQASTSLGWDIFLANGSLVTSTDHMPIKASCTIDDSADPVSSNILTNGVSYSFGCSVKSSLSAGPHTMKVFVQDETGHYTGNGSIGLIVDTTAPVASLAAVPMTASSASMNLSIPLSDVGAGLWSYTVKFNGATVSASTQNQAGSSSIPLGTTSMTVTAPVTLQPGANTLTVELTDYARYNTFVTKTINYSGIAPKQGPGKTYLK